jgi:hypothetical protein
VAAAVLIFTWGLLTALAAWWLLCAKEAPAPAGPADPYASEVARFRAELHDWDRHGRP